MTLQFSRSIYDADAVQATVAAFGELATWSVEIDEHGVTVHMTDPTPEIDDLADHFANHALHLTITSARRSAEGAQ